MFGVILLFVVTLWQKVGAQKLKSPGV